MLAAVGIYGTMSYAVVRRTHEIGVRMSLGAGRREVLRVVIGRAATLALMGVAAGLVMAVGLTRLLSGLLFGVHPNDPATFGGVALMVSVVSILASYIPARRAMGVDPTVALRHE
jgi:putative ABC transport system permease protein